jgi:hypothetical protein
MSNLPRRNIPRIIAFLFGLSWSIAGLADSAQPIIGSRQVSWLDTFDWTVFAIAGVLAMLVAALWGLGAATQQRLGGSGKRN